MKRGIKRKRPDSSPSPGPARSCYTLPDPRPQGPTLQALPPYPNMGSPNFWRDTTKLVEDPLLTYQEEKTRPVPTVDRVLTPFYRVEPTPLFCPKEHVCIWDPRINSTGKCNTCETVLRTHHPHCDREWETYFAQVYFILLTESQVERVPFNNFVVCHPFLDKPHTWADPNRHTPYCEKLKAILNT